MYMHSLLFLGSVQKSLEAKFDQKIPIKPTADFQDHIAVSKERREKHSFRICCNYYVFLYTGSIREGHCSFWSTVHNGAISWSKYDVL